MILIAAILFVLILSIDEWVDYKRKRPFKHNDKWWRGLALMPTVVMLSCHVPGTTLFGLAYAWCMVGFSYWTLFDGIANLLQRESWNYIGPPDEWDPNLDKFQRRYPFVWIAKIIVSIGLKIGYIVMVL